MGNPKGSQRDAPLTVTFPIPRKSASKLRTMAVSRDRRLLDLGVLAVQINEGESIVLGIKLGKQRIKNTEVSSEKMRGNASRGRVKKPSTCRNVATIHHLPNAFSSQAPHAHKLQTKQTVALSLGNDEGKRKKGTDSDGDIMGHNLFSDSRKTAGKPSSNCNQFHLSDFTNSCDLSLNGHTSSTELSAHHNNRLQNNALEEDFISSGSNVQKTTNPAIVSSRKASVESHLSAAQTLSSPASLRAFSTSPSSDTSSTSSEENFALHHDQLIYNCFVDKSKYSAADMLKKLAKSVEVKKTAISTPVVNKVSYSVKTSFAAAKSSSSGSSLLQGLKVLDNIERSSYISGSYRDHVKSIRCNSLTSMTTSTSTVTATLKIPAATTDQTLGFQNSISHNEKPSVFGDRIPSQLTQHTSQHITLPTPSAASQTKDIETNNSKTDMYHEGRKVLWSSANAFPRSKASSAHTPFDKSVAGFSQGNSLCSNNSTFLSQVQETFSESTSRPSRMKSDASTCSDVIKSTPSESYCSIHMSKKMPEQGSVNETIVTQSDSKMVSIKTSSLSFGSQDLPVVTAHHASSPHTTESASSASFPEATSIVQTEHTSMGVVQNLTMGTPVIPAPIVVAGTNTQTTWSNQQVSPTYFVGAQGQYGIYSTLYSPDVNNNQLGQQAVATATGYPLNYVYPVSFVYPYLTMAAQADNIKSSSNVLQNKNAQVMETDAFIDKTKITKPEPGVDSKETTVTTAITNLQPTTSTAPSPAQTQFIDLASSMRYWQQINLLYRSRLQALASCNLSSASALSSSQVNADDTATSTTDSKESTTAVGNDEKAVKSNAEELSFSKPEISQANFGSYPEETQINDFSKENVSSKILQPIKPEINVEEESGLNNMTDNCPSVVIASSCNSVNKTSKSPVKIQGKQEDFGSGTKGTDSVSFGTSSMEVCSAKLHHDQLRHMDDGSMIGTMPASLKRSFYGSPPKLSFIHDSSIACVNVGNRNGSNGFASSPGSKIAFGTQLDTAVHPAKRRKSKKSL